MSNPTKESTPPFVIDLSLKGRSEFYERDGTNYDKAFNAALKSAADRQGQTVQEYLANSTERRYRISNLEYLTGKLGEDRNGNFDPQMAQSKYDSLISGLSKDLGMNLDDIKKGVTSSAGIFPDGEKFLNFLNKVSSGDPRSINSFKAHLQSYKDGHVNDAWMNLVDNTLHELVMEQEGNKTNVKNGTNSENTQYRGTFSESIINDGLPFPQESTAQTARDNSGSGPELYLPYYSTTDCLKPILVMLAAVAVTYLLSRKSNLTGLQRETSLQNTKQKSPGNLKKFFEKVRNSKLAKNLSDIVNDTKSLFDALLGKSGAQTLSPAQEHFKQGDLITENQPQADDSLKGVKFKGIVLKTPKGTHIAGSNRTNLKDPKAFLKQNNANPIDTNMQESAFVKNPGRFYRIQK